MANIFLAIPFAVVVTVGIFGIYMMGYLHFGEKDPDYWENVENGEKLLFAGIAVACVLLVLGGFLAAIARLIHFWGSAL